ncbi:MAG: SDR family oxidoreductase [Deinococcota bacterium]|jgi:NAD(P)-dependent dehydrogenase (short-subunit alcohol dehydrogenase family)|nr:SDR family oxidoreductase [Deinococcota bacterium]
MTADFNGLDFRGKVAVITGAGQGIGRAIALTFARAGAKVMLFDYQEAQALERELEGHEAAAFKVDVTDTQGVQEATAQVMQAFGRIDILVNNAGVISSKPFTECSEKDWDQVLDVNLKGVFNTCHAVFPIMMAQRYGKIVNVASIAGKRGGGVFGNTVYAASKGGVIALTKGLAREGGPYGINVNAVCPGPTNTVMLKDFGGERRENFLKSIPLRRFSEPEDIAGMVLFLASELARQVTGEISDVDGGIMMD